MSILKSNRPINNISGMFRSGKGQTTPYPKVAGKNHNLPAPNHESPVDLSELSAPSSKAISPLSSSRKAELKVATFELSHPTLGQNKNTVDVNNVMELQDGIQTLDKRMI